MFPADAILFPVVVAGDHVTEPWTLYRVDAAVAAETVCGYYAERLAADTDGERPVSPEPVESNVEANTDSPAEPTESTPTLRTIQDVQDAIQYTDTTPAQPTLIRPKISVHSFLATDAVQPEPDRTVQPDEIPGAKSFYEKALGWRLVISLRHNGIYLYGEQKSAEIPTRTRGRDSVDGVLADITGKDEGENRKAEKGKGEGRKANGQRGGKRE